MKVFVDTNLLIRLLNENYPPLENIKLVTFEKNIYEYSNGIKNYFGTDIF